MNKKIKNHGLSEKTGIELEQFKPISVKSPSSSKFVFWLRCFFDLQLASIVKYLKPALRSLSGNLLDVGTGESPWKYWLPANVVFKGLDIYSSSKFGMKSCRDDVVYYDGVSFPFVNSTFDCVLCIEVLEHAENPDFLISEISRVIKPGGKLLLTAPWSARLHHLPYDYQRFSKNKIFSILSKNGFNDIEITERSSDIGSIANKLTVLAYRLIRPNKYRFSHIWMIPLGFVNLFLAFLFIVSAHFADYFGYGSKLDPLGYYVSALRNE